MDSSKFMEASIEDLIRNPGKYGAPTFQEFCANPDKYRKNKEAMISSADAGSRNISGIKKHLYYVDGYKCSTPEEAQQAMKNMGLSEDDLKLSVELEDMGNHEIRAHVHFKRKSNLILPEGI